MALRWKNFVPNTPLKSTEVNDLANNGVVQIDTATDLDDANLVDANLAFDLASNKLFQRQSAGVGADKWKPVGGGRMGSPAAPVLSADLSFTDPAAGSAGPTFGYGATVTPETAVDALGAAQTVVLTVDQATRRVTAKGTVPFIDYTFTVFAVNAAGAGAESNPITMQFNFNEATGGTVTDVTNYNGTGKKYRVHVFDGNADLVVLQSVHDFRVLAVGGGGDGGGGQPYGAAGHQGASGEAREITTALTAGTHPVVVGGPGGASSVATLSVAGSANTPRITSDIMGSPAGYPYPNGIDGATGCTGGPGGPGEVPGGGGGGGGGIGNCAPFTGGPGGAGAHGRVYVAYEIA